MAKYQISIPEPCHENWNEMTPTEQGKFCDVCSKEIYDMRQFTNRELAHKIKQNEKICGVFNQNQLNVDLYANSNSKLSRFGLLFSITSLLTVTQPAQAQDTPKVNTNQQCDSTKTSTKPMLLGKIVAPSTVTLKGVVTDDMGVTPGATVQIKNSDREITTDFDGNFEFVLNNNKPVTIVVSYTGYQSKEVTVSNFSQKTTILLESKYPKEKPMLMGVVTVKASDLKVSNPKNKNCNSITKKSKPNKRTIFTRIANLFRKKENRR